MISSLCVLPVTPVLKHGPRSHSMLQTETLFVKVHLSGIEWTRKVVNYS